MPISLSNLNKQQQEAVTYCDTPLLVIAGAGTGKTKVIIHKIAYLIEDLQIDPANILSVTFTNKAAKEMKQRLKAIIGAKADQVWMGTFHSICLRILRKETHNIPMKRGFGIIDQDDRLSALKNIIKELNIDHKKYPPKQYLWMISNFKNSMDYVEDKDPGDFLYKFVDVFTKYQKYLEFTNMLDFDDMIAFTLRLLLADISLKKFYQNMFQYILVDEYQDTNYVQFMFLKLLNGEDGKICVVGDDDQSIYGWRGAEIRNILDFDKHFKDVNTIKLTVNYRSSPDILFAANTLIANNKFRKGKNLISAFGNDKKHLFKSEMGNIAIAECHDEIHEAKIVVDKIEELLKQNVPPSEIAVLYRTNAQSRGFEVELNKRKIPYKVIGGISFYSRREIKDILAYLKLIDNPYDVDALKRAAKNPPKGIGNVIIQKIIDYASANAVDLLEAINAIRNISGGKTYRSLQSFENVIENTMREEKITDKIKTILASTGYNIYLKQFEEQNEAAKRINNIEELINAAAIFEENTENYSLTDFLATTTLTTSADENTDNSVSLMTLHSAKGLEFHSVFLTGLEEGLFPIFRAMEAEMELEEERRLCYVGITRAKEKLFFTYTNTRMVYGKRQFSTPSMFVEEIKHCIPNSENNRDDSLSTPGLKANTKVFHQKYGDGIILNVKGNGEKAKVDVFFREAGLKKMLAESLEIF